MELSSTYLERKKLAYDLYMQGWTLKAIGNEMGLTRERIRQYCKDINPDHVGRRFHQKPIRLFDWTCKRCQKVYTTPAKQRRTRCIPCHEEVAQNIADRTPKIIELYHQGLGQPQIARELGIGRGTVSHIIIDSGLSYMQRELVKLRHDRVEKLYKGQSTIEEIMEATGYCAASVHNILLKSKLTRNRKRGRKRR